MRSLLCPRLQAPALLRCPPFLIPAKLLVSNTQFQTGGAFIFRFILVAISVTAIALAGVDQPPPPPLPDAIVQSYCAATQKQELAESLKTASMDVDIAASVPRLKKQGRLHALRTIFARKRVTYDKVRFEGDNRIKTDVIVRYLTAEADARKEPEGSAVTPANYKFKYKGQSTLDGRAVHVFDVSPKQKRERLFKGQIWIDAATYLLVQESGVLVKKPSMMMRNVAFVRNYEIRDGASVPVKERSTADIFLVGRVEMTIDFSNFALEDAIEQLNPR